MTEVMAFVTAQSAQVATLPLPIMLLAATALLAVGTPVLILLASLTAIQGWSGLGAAGFALYAATIAIHVTVRAVRRPTSTGPKFPWLCVGAALVPFWPFIVLATLRGARLGALIGAVAVVSTPNLVLFGLALLLGRSFDIPPLIVSAGAAGLAVLTSLLVRRRWSERRDDFSPPASVQRS